MVQVWVPTVTVIGTCRVHDTLRKVQSSGLINLDNGGMNSFVHTLPEILLRLEVMSKSSEYLQDIVDIQVGTRSGVKLRPEETFDIRESDVIVIEISSLKAIFYQNHPLQFNEVNRHLCTPNGEFGIKLRDEINSAFNNGGCKINIPDLPYPESIPQRYKQIITGLQPMLMDEESIHFYLDQVVDFAGKIPILGICLGHQSIGQAFGGEIIRAKQVMHGKTSMIHHNNSGVFANLSNPYEATRYHSLVIDQNTLPDCFEVTAWTQNDDGSIDEIMGVRHKEMAVQGVQFHPESILTQHGHDLLDNFLKG